MILSTPRIVLLLSGSILLACSSGGSLGGDATQNGASTRDTDPGKQIPDAPSNPIAPGLLSGTWDLTGSAGGASTTGVMELGANVLDVTFGDYTLHLGVDGSGTTTTSWKNPGETRPFPSSHTPDTVDTGALPFPVGGAWSFGSDNELCTSQLSGTSLTATCNDSIGERPQVIPSLHGTAHATRTVTATSSFGALGGVWTFDGQANGCVAKVYTENMEWSCPTGDGFAGIAKITFSTANGKASASGTTGNGVIFSGLKR